MAKKSLIVGGAGALGRGVIQVFKNKGWKVASLDFASNDKADANIVLQHTDKLPIADIYKQVSGFSSR